MSLDLDARPILIAIAGPNGAGKSTFHNIHLSYTELPFMNADAIALETSLGAYEAAAVAEAMREQRIARRESFIFETVFSDPVADKVAFLEAAAASGYTVVVFFVGISSAERSSDRVAMRVLEGGHNVPEEKLAMRFDRTLHNLKLSMQRLPAVRVYDNDDLRDPFRLCLQTSMGTVIERIDPLPEWLVSLLPDKLL